MTRQAWRQRPVAVALTGALVVWSVPGEALRLTVEVRDGNAARDAERVAIEVDEAGEVDLRRVRNGEYEHQGSPPKQRLRLAVRAPKDFTDRDIALKVPRAVLKPDVRMRVHLMSAVEITYQTAGKAAKCLERKEYDSCLAWFEYAERARGGGGKLSQLQIRVKYNYALSLREACQFLAYDTCGTAVEQLDALIAQYPGNEDVSAKEVSLKTLGDARLIARRIEITGRYDAIRALYAQANYGAAAALAETVIAGVDRGDFVLEGTDITLDRLRLDAGSARSRLGDALLGRTADPEDVSRNWQTAIGHFGAVKTLAVDQARRERDAVQTKLDRLGR